MESEREEHRSYGLETGPIQSHCPPSGGLSGILPSCESSQVPRNLSSVFVCRRCKQGREEGAATSRALLGHNHFSQAGPLPQQRFQPHGAPKDPGGPQPPRCTRPPAGSGQGLLCNEGGRLQQGQGEAVDQLGDLG